MHPFRLFQNISRNFHFVTHFDPPPKKKRKQLTLNLRYKRSCSVTRLWKLSVQTYIDAPEELELLVIESQDESKGLEDVAIAIAATILSLIWTQTKAASVR